MASGLVEAKQWDYNMNYYDKILRDWAITNAEAIYKHLETNINPAVNWRNENIVDIVVEGNNWPSTWKQESPYLEELPHVLNDYSYDYGVPFPPEIIAYKLSLWVGQTIPKTHPLVVNSKHWYEVALNIDFDNNHKADEVELIKLLRDITADEELLNNLPTVEDIIVHHDAPLGDGRLYIVNMGESLLYLAITDDNVYAMNNDGKVVVLDFDGNRINVGNTDRIRSYIIGGLKFSNSLTDKGELASIVGNRTADFLSGYDGLSVFDLPDYEE